MTYSPLTLFLLTPGCVGVSADILIDSTHSAVRESRLFRCLICSGLTCILGEMLVEGGSLYNKAIEHFTLEDQQTYQFPYDGVTAKYNENTNQLIPVEVRGCFVVYFEGP